MFYQILERIRTILTFLFIVIGHTAFYGQTLDEQLRLQHLYHSDLLRTRGAKPLMRDEVTVDNIKEVLIRFDNTGILLYTHLEETLSITLISVKHPILQTKIMITEESLTQQVTDVNTLIQSSGSKQFFTNRGSKVISQNKERNKQEKSYDNLNNILLPFKELNDLNHLIIVPVLNLATLPYAAFKLSDQKFLIDEMSYSISPSLYEVSVSNEINNRKGEVEYDFKSALFISNPDFSTIENYTFEPLPYTTWETDHITKSFNNPFLLLEGKNATKDNILNEIEDYELLYFATHGVASNEDALDKSYLVFSGDDEENSFLTAREIQDIHLLTRRSLKAKLVVLSACQTGLGNIQKGGVIGLARAFQIAGAHNVLMSLWSIDDKQTAILMRMFFDELKNGGEMLPHGALRNAIIKYKKNNNDPNVWASFSLFGNPRQNYNLKKYSDSFNIEGFVEKNDTNKFEFNLLPVEFDTVEGARTIKNEISLKDSLGVVKVNTKDSEVVLQVINNGTSPFYFSIVEINSAGDIIPFFPNSECLTNIDETKVEAGETVIFEDCIFSFSPPLGKLILKGFATSNPINLKTIEFPGSKKKKVMNEPAITHNKFEGYTSELIYEIIE